MGKKTGEALRNMAGFAPMSINSANFNRIVFQGDQILST